MYYAPHLKCQNIAAPQGNLVLVDFRMLRVIARSHPKSTATQASNPSNRPPACLQLASSHSLQQDPILAGLLSFTPKHLDTVREGIIVKHIADFESVLFLFGISTEHGVREPFVWVLEAEYSRDSALQRDSLI
jgi:hypothetical protein